MVQENVMLVQMDIYQKLVQIIVQYAQLVHINIMIIAKNVVQELILKLEQLIAQFVLKDIYQKLAQIIVVFVQLELLNTIIMNVKNVKRMRIPIVAQLFVFKRHLT